MPLIIFCLLTPPSSLFLSRFFEDLKDMLGFTPYRFYYYMWKFITPILLLVLLGSSFIQLIMTPPSYSAWIEDKVSRPRGGFGWGGGGGISGGRGSQNTWKQLKVNERIQSQLGLVQPGTRWGGGGAAEAVFQPADNQQDVCGPQLQQPFDVKRLNFICPARRQLIGCCGQWPPK